MDIKKLTLNEIGEKIKKFFPPYLQSDFHFQENYKLQFDEIKHNIPTKYHKAFNDGDILNVASGNIEVVKPDYDYTVILVSNENYSDALFLLLQKENKKTGDIETELITSFLLANIEK